MQCETVVHGGRFSTNYRCRRRAITGDTLCAQHREIEARGARADAARDAEAALLFADAALKLKDHPDERT